MQTKSRSIAGSERAVPQTVIDIVSKIFLIGLIASLALFGYLIYGLLSGQLANLSTVPKADQRRILELIQSVSQYFNISLVITLICAVVLFYEVETAGVIMLLLAGFLAYGLQLSIDFLFAGEAGRLLKGPASALTLQEIKTASVLIGAPGALLFLRNLYLKIADGRRGEDLANMTYGKEVAKEDVPRAPIGAFAKCWQLPFCREGIRVHCPIYHAKTKCWKERVGCMCEENVLRLAMGGEERKPIDMTKESGFVPIGDLIVKSEALTKAAISTRVGPRGVRIPTNPHITDAQKRERCRNCVIYNEHQRMKYNFYAPIVTIIVPILVMLQFDQLRVMLKSGLHMLDSLIAHIKFTPSGTDSTSSITTTINGSLPIEAILIGIITLLVMTWVLHVLEFCTFKLKI